MRELVRFLVVVKDPAVVLIYDHNVVTLGAEAVGSFADTGTDAKDRVEQRDVSHACSLPATPDIVGACSDDGSAHGTAVGSAGGAAVDVPVAGRGREPGAVLAG